MLNYNENGLFWRVGQPLNAWVLFCFVFACQLNPNVIIFPAYLHKSISVGTQPAKFGEASEERQVRDCGRGGDKDVPHPHPRVDLRGYQRLRQGLKGSFSPGRVSQLTLLPLSFPSWPGHVTWAIAIGHGFPPPRTVNRKRLLCLLVCVKGTLHLRGCHSFSNVQIAT